MTFEQAGAEYARLVAEWQAGRGLMGISLLYMIPPIWNAARRGNSAPHR